MRAAMPEPRAKEKGALRTRPFRLDRVRRPLLEPARGVRQHGVDLAGVRGEIAARGRLAALVLRDLVQQPLELADVAIDRLLNSRSPR